MTRAVYKMDLQGVLNDVPVMNSLYWLTSSSSATFTEAGEIANAAVTAGLWDAYLACLSDNYTGEALRVRGIVTQLETDPVTLDSPVSTPAYVTLAGGGPGTRTGTIQSNQAGPLISLLPTTFEGERARVNKIFLPGINEADADDDLVVAGVRTAVEDFIAVLQTGLIVTAGTVTWVALIKKYILQDPPDPPIELHLIRGIQAAAAETFVASQRQRRPHHV